MLLRSALLLCALLLFPPNSLASFPYDITGLNSIEDVYAQYNVYTIHGHGMFDRDMFYTAKNPTIIITDGLTYVINGDVIYPGANSYKKAQAEYDAANPGKSFANALKAALSPSANNILLVDQSKIKDLGSSELLPSVQKPDGGTIYSLSDTLRTANRFIDNRISGSISFAGISSGGYLEDSGIWVSYFHTLGTQKPYAFNTGYKLNQNSMSIGIEKGEEIKVGVAYSFVRSAATSSDVNVKDIVTSNIGTLYGSVIFDDSFLLSLRGSYGSSKIDKARNGTSAKTGGNLLDLKASVSYIYESGHNITLAPKMGVSYSQINLRAYGETGQGVIRNVSKHEYIRNSLFLGFDVSTKIELGDFGLSPTFFTKIDYSANQKISNTNIFVVSANSNYNVPNTLPSKLMYDLGTELSLLPSENISGALFYDLGLAKNFISHTCGIKARFAF